MMASSFSHLQLHRSVVRRVARRQSIDIEYAIFDFGCCKTVADLKMYDVGTIRAETNSRRENGPREFHDDLTPSLSSNYRFHPIN